ncbi:hypothetical protein T440DRAFT_200554 [Plenodomus tracheiphilus IPT5]|uniref:Uncharacterized protein n=1 Tax=Plenodomus tracheiphilus IPT5 TaxID=1408161 RepID=A0A6A7BHW3_9PLEO|nr:hypothetical protein T440DRAFT_200554 [Plenodomus tracheiphilus IPT5]
MLRCSCAQRQSRLSPQASSLAHRVHLPACRNVAPSCHLACNWRPPAPRPPSHEVHPLATRVDTIPLAAVPSRGAMWRDRNRFDCVGDGGGTVVWGKLMLDCSYQLPTLQLPPTRSMAFSASTCCMR